MPAPDSTIEEVRASVLKYIRMYEEGQITLGDLSSELAVMAPAYEYAMGAVEDHWGHLLNAAHYRSRDNGSSLENLEEALTNFRRTEAAWE